MVNIKAASIGPRDVISMDHYLFNAELKRLLTMDKLSNDYWLARKDLLLRLAEQWPAKFAELMG